MTAKKDNIKALFSNTRTRIIIVFTVVLVVTTIIIGIVKFHKSFGDSGKSDMSRSPGAISSIPGSLNQTAQYAALQQQQNIQNAKDAASKGKSSIPTIIRAQSFGEGVESVGATGGQGSVGFSTLTRESTSGPQSTLWFQNLKDTNCSKDSIDKAVNENNASISDLKLACSCEQLHMVGYQLEDLRVVCSCSELRTIGITASAFKQAGYKADALKKCGFTACQEKGAGFTAQQMKNAGYSDGELKGAGFSEEAIAKAGGIPDGISIADIKKAGCSVEGLKRLRAAGVSAAAIRRNNGCSVMQMKAAGFSPTDLKNAGFSAAELKVAGFTPDQLKSAEYNARDLLNAGFTPDELKEAGFTENDLKAAEAELPPGFSHDDIKKSGCSGAALNRERLAGASAAIIKKDAKCSAKQLKSAGFNDDDLDRAGFSPEQIKSSGFTAEGIGATVLANQGVRDSRIKSAGCDIKNLTELRKSGVTAQRIHELNGCSTAALKAAGFDAEKLLIAGFTPDELQSAGFSPEDIKEGQAAISGGKDISDSTIRAAGCDENNLTKLKKEGVSAKRIHDLNGCSVAALKAAGFNAEKLLKAGFSPDDLRAAGFSPEDIKEGQVAIAGEEYVGDSKVKAAGCDINKLKILHDDGVSAQRIHDLNGCSAAALKAVGFNAEKLLEAGFTPDELKSAGLTPDEIKEAQAALHSSGESVADYVIKSAGCDTNKLKELEAQGVSAKRIHELNGCSAEKLKAAGFDVAEIAAAGFTPADLLAAGFTPQDLENANAALTPAGIIAAGRGGDCSVKSLEAAKDTGVSAETIKNTLGCSAAALKAAGFSAADLKNAGFTSGELSNVGFSPEDLKDAGYTAKELRAVGFSAADLKKAGFGATSLQDAGFSADDLKAAGFSVADLKKAGFSAEDLKKSGFSAAELHKAGYTAKELKQAGFGVAALKNAGLSDSDLEEAGVSKSEAALAGLEKIDPLESQKSKASVLPSLLGKKEASQDSIQMANTKRLQEIMAQQKKTQLDQKYQQKIQKQSSLMLSDATQLLQGWKTVSAQQYAEGTKQKSSKSGGDTSDSSLPSSMASSASSNSSSSTDGAVPLIRMGDIIFAVVDTSVNTDEPGPILATIVSGIFKGGKLIGSFNLPNNSDKLIISFNSLAMPGSPKTMSITAFAIDPNTGRTALSSETDHHYLERYGALFASTFIEGFGNAFQSSDTAIQIGGTGGVTNTTIQNGIGRSSLENAVIGLATVGKAWGQVAQQNISRPTTVQIYSGTAIGVLFTQDLLPS
ncbi:MAG: hypothetical protein A3E88_04585 [Legionellales bacterium RIFCSPHIGHO2_12_FULL_35_11]|nr:MAG: hypothetical protein A3E88_04585 [Legionellales bacterium RIFCSPHIGHO2_12_FULL_35_11]